jgi:hypothetical protein
MDHDTNNNVQNAIERRRQARQQHPHHLEVPITTTTTPSMGHDTNNDVLDAVERQRLATCKQQTHLEVPVTTTTTPSMGHDTNNDVLDAVERQRLATCKQQTHLEVPVTTTTTPRMDHDTNNEPAAAGVVAEVATNKPGIKSLSAYKSMGDGKISTTTTVGGRVASFVPANYNPPILPSSPRRQQQGAIYAAAPPLPYQNRTKSPTPMDGPPAI